eukprot:CAMPEP_0180171116 /NCGR_PEP_ID=MMETSP0986-20121125/34228_1 /TAXON_ID=697907 /ORGANISM="non described non described, Strain CCMP2293" /LENGTH=146 /DNA_ID=CAMNT_0022122931 /DNA_START=85 /DNA_END=526 /DNA_ORIENTATION=-
MSTLLHAPPPARMINHVAVLPIPRGLSRGPRSDVGLASLDRSIVRLVEAPHFDVPRGGGVLLIFNVLAITAHLMAALQRIGAAILTRRGVVGIGGAERARVGAAPLWARLDDLDLLGWVMAPHDSMLEVSAFPSQLLCVQTTQQHH